MPPKGNRMNATPKFLAATAHVDDAAIQPLPNSRKVYVGPLRVPMREVSQADTPSMFGGEPNPPVYVYDCSGPYTDPAAKIAVAVNTSASENPRWDRDRAAEMRFMSFSELKRSSCSVS